MCISYNVYPYQILFLAFPEHRLLACEFRSQERLGLRGWDCKPAIGSCSLLSPTLASRLQPRQLGMPSPSLARRGSLFLVYLVNQRCLGQHSLPPSSRLVPIFPRLRSLLARQLSSPSSLRALSLSPGRSSVRASICCRSRVAFAELPLTVQVLSRKPP